MSNTKWVSFRLPPDRHEALTNEAIRMGHASVAAALRHQVVRTGLDVVRQADYASTKEKVVDLTLEALDLADALKKAKRERDEAMKAAHDARQALDGALRIARTSRWLAIAATVLAMAPAAITIYTVAHRQSPDWHTAPAPVNTPVTIQADAYYDGITWRSYDNGMPINTEPNQWKERK